MTESVRNTVERTRCRAPARRAAISVAPGRFSVPASVVAVLAMALGACSSSSGVSQEYAKWRETVYQDLVALSAGEEPVRNTNPQVVDSMDAALRMAAEQDLLLARRRQAVNEGDIGVEGAGTLAWPRLGLEANIDYPLRDGNDGAAGSGGLFLRYNLNEAIFRKDALTAAELRQSLEVQRYRERLRQLYWELRVAVSDYACTELRREKIAAAREAAGQARDAARRLLDMGRGDSALLNVWEARSFDFSTQVEEADLRLSLVRKRLDAYLGGADFSRLTDHALEVDFGAQARRLTEVSDAQLLQQGWQGNPRLREADLTAQLAEYEVLKARRAQLPRFSLRLGYGDIDVGNNQQDSSLVASVGINYPLIDLGDGRRQVETAQAGRDRAREEMQSTARGLSATLAEGRMKLRISSAQLRHAERALQRAAGQLELLEQLQLRGRSDSFDLAKARIDSYVKVSERCLRQVDVVKAIGELSLLQGVIPDDVQLSRNREPVN